MRFNQVINNFSSGEWSPRMRARTDTDQYIKSAKEITNGIVQVQGGVFKRPGTIKRTTAFNLAVDHILIPFSSGNIKYLVITDGTNWKYQNVATGTEANVTIAFTIGSGLFPADFRYEQLGDVLFITHPSHPPMVLYYNPNILGLSLDEYQTYYSILNKRGDDIWRSWPFKNKQVDGAGGTMTLTGTLTKGGTVTVTTSLDVFSMSHIPTGAGRINLVIRISSAADTAVLKITGVTDSKTATGVMLSNKAGTSPLVVGSASGTSYALSDWNGRDGWPSTVTAHQGRLVFGRKDTLYFTRAGNVYDLMELPFQQATSAPTYVNALSDGSRPFSAKPYTTSVGKIQELTSAKTLLVLMNTQELVGYGGSNGITALAGGLIFESSSSFGASRVPPIRINNFTTFAQATTKTLRDITFNWEQSQYKAMDLSFPAEHMFRDSGIYRLASAELGVSVLFALKYDGSLSIVSLDRDYSLNAWAELSLGGGAIVEAIAVVRADKDGEVDRVYITATLGGATSLLEMTSFYESPDYDFVANSTGPLYMDFIAISSKVAPTKTHPGFSHLTGLEVDVIADNFYVGRHTVVGGSITLANAASLVVAGLPYKFRLEPSSVEAGARMGDATGKLKRPDTIFIRLHNTLGCKYGDPNGDMYDIPFREDTQPMDEHSKMRDIDVQMHLPNSYERTSTVVVESEYPFPCNVLAIGVQGITYE